MCAQAYLDLSFRARILPRSFEVDFFVGICKAFSLFDYLATGYVFSYGGFPLGVEWLGSSLHKHDF